MKTSFDLNKKQEEQLRVWKTEIKKEHGKYGTYTYSFSPYGMGTGIEVYSHLACKSIDLSNVEDW